MKNFWARFKRWFASDDAFDVALREHAAVIERRLQADKDAVEEMNAQAAAHARRELRDRFAIAALTGIMANQDGLSVNRDERAVEAWKQADAMLKARGDE